MRVGLALRRPVSVDRVAPERASRRSEVVGGEHFDAVVVGSGFGGAVTAYRLAEAGLSVCVLERGRPYPPGSFPRSPIELGSGFWSPAEHAYGLFDLRSFRDRLVTLTASGLGGGSLIYAAVLLRKDERWFVQDDGAPGGERWPLTRADLDPHYARVERMLSARPYPLASGPPYRDTPKTLQLRLAADELGLEWQLPNLGITFAVPGHEPAVGAPLEPDDNLHGAERRTCRLCGECNLGCNAGSKNSLDLTYLSAARRHGAEIRTLAEARRVAPRPGGGYVVRYADHARAGGGVPPVREVTADTLVLAAGTLGTTELLLRSRPALPRLSPMLGRRFSANGDRLAFAVRARDGARRTREFRPSFGPVITGALRVPDGRDGAGDGARGFYVEDAGYPAFLAGWA
ncbi:MAG TPA: FAD-dependent oxidoreductase, partial [Thermomicrobiaceae bacterium]|nr:FAD-dependent oxidoreductase [Thermomicrobiaceae bacterium]